MKTRKKKLKGTSENLQLPSSIFHPSGRAGSGKREAERDFRDALKKYPGGEIIVKGLRDINQGRFKSIEALAVLTASPRLNELGFHIDEFVFAEPHLLLYAHLQKKYSDSAHEQYNALMLRVAKFCNHYAD